ncbi:NAD(P)H-hydrate dehydratase [Arthrobacter cavernae]|uniref:Bifunctional NAD(P)H-hydrate repair enzyme n=1 Tax=Arthrobacter cavernae TaxID=2817681 RepID=A0A939HF64_9MICC|nr:NAD(P)H-hydrate dehydratase [Arthrobacter cavernae]MBO1267228.1 NAD(P)H-hydrate dehydratase [Arthrobacter cavernae]
MISAFTGTDVRAAEQPLLDPRSDGGAVLMQRAAHGLAAAIVSELRARGQRFAGSGVTVLAGKGNNGGDGLFAASFLARRGMRTTAVLTAGSAHTEALAAFTAAGGRVLILDSGSNAGSNAGNAEELAVLCAGDDVVIDAVLGTGARGGLRGAAAELVAALQELRPRLVVACDVPSGVDADTGEVHWPVLDAQLTVTFGGIKAGLLADPGEGCAGRVQLVPIGIESLLPAPVLRRFSTADLAALLPSPGRRAHKYSRGVLGVVAGSEKYAGAAVLSVHAAVVSGAGMVRYLGPAAVARQVLARTPEALWEGAGAEGANGSGGAWPGRVQAWLVGPGLDGAGQLENARDALAAALDGGQPAVVDAGALELLPDRCPPHWILTPHAGELSALLGRSEMPVTREDVESRPLHFVRLAAEHTGATVLLKGATTLVASPSGAVFSQSEGCPWMATAGSGDVLAGILGALLAQCAGPGMDDDGAFAALGVAPEDRWAALGAVAVSLHGLAGSAASGVSRARFDAGAGGGPVTALGIADAVSGVWAQIVADRL